MFFFLQLPSGEEIPLPPIILGHLGSDPAKKTVCIYGHLDVQPAQIEDGWDTEPFTLVEKDGTFRAALKRNMQNQRAENETALLEVKVIVWNRF